MDLTTITTVDLLRALIDESERREMWERATVIGSHRSYYDDAVILDDIIRELAGRIDGAGR